MNHTEIKRIKKDSLNSFNHLISEIKSHVDDPYNQKIFDYIVKVYLQQAYPDFSHVWLINEVPTSININGHSVKISRQEPGVNLIAKDANTGELTAIHAHFDPEWHKINKRDLRPFINAITKPTYSAGIWIASSANWNHNAERTLQKAGTKKPVSRIGLYRLRHAPLNWSRFDSKNLTNNNRLDLKLPSRKKLRSYQKIAVRNALRWYRNGVLKFRWNDKKGKYVYSDKAKFSKPKNDRIHRRGKLIMAPGTGKTYTSLNIAETLQNSEHAGDFYVLYLVPSIQLLSQTLFNWNQDKNSDITMISFAVTSDNKATRRSRKKTDIDPIDLGYAPTTNAQKLIQRYVQSVDQTQHSSKKRMFVVFSTYQSIDVIHDAQYGQHQTINRLPDFDLIVADEAHRTAGNYQHGNEGYFTKVHHDSFIYSKYRLYQTATPKIYDSSSKRKGKQHSIVVRSMDDPHTFGDTFYQLNFGHAIEYGILTDYKVQVLTIDRNYIEKNMQKAISNDDGIHISDAGEIIGTWNAMLKRKSFSNHTFGKPMKRAIAFASVIDNRSGSKNRRNKVGSKQIARYFNQIINKYLSHGDQADNDYQIDVRHVDGSMNAMQKEQALDWLSGNIPEGQAHVLSNVRFLGEGVDVPSLDAVIFFAPKKSVIDIVQAVGRVMRRSPGKRYGYVIIPIVVPFGVKPEDVLDNSKTYKKVWQVLNALRSIDPRMDWTINKLRYQKGTQQHQRVDVNGQRNPPSKKLRPGKDQDQKPKTPEQLNLFQDWDKLSNAIYGEVVKHVGDRRYLDDWSDDVQAIAKHQISWIKLKLRDKSSTFTQDFNRYLIGLRRNINDDVTREQAIEMLAQHIITKPVFDALFSGNDFVNNNPVSKAMQGIVHQMQVAGFQQEQEKLAPFYHSVKMRATGITDPEDKQEFIRTLYSEFFKKSFKKYTERYGIVFTPVPVVNFIVHSVDYALHKYFHKSIASHGVHILDPFVGTGTFITQTLYYLAYLHEQGKISIADIVHKYTSELHCNEIVLLSYYIAAVNIESVFNEIVHNKKYQEFKGIVLTDTFESTERANTLDDGIFNGNNERLAQENKTSIRVIMSNPPYSVGQRSQNDSQNEHYPKLDNAIKNSYVKYSVSGLPRSVYDSYIKAIRWSSDRIGKRGILGFVTNGEYINSRSANGLRKCLHDEFNYLYIYNLRGNQRTSGEQSRKEGGKIFGSGSRTPVAISIMIKDGSSHHQIFYKDIGDYLSRDDKFKILNNKNSIGKLNWQPIHPDKYNDWINQRDPRYQKFMPLHNKKQESIFPNNASNVKTNRDTWVYGFSKLAVAKHVKTLIHNYNFERIRLVNKSKADKEKLINLDPKFIKWSPALKTHLDKNLKIIYRSNHIRLALYRPFVRKWLYYDKYLNEDVNLYYTQLGKHNLVIFTTGRGTQRPFSTMSTNLIPGQLLSAGQGFMRYNNEKSNTSLVQPHRDNINSKFARELGLSTDDTFYYIYGILNSPEYQRKYKNDLKKDLARIPVVKNVAPFVKIGHKLMDLHVNYEHVAPYKDVKIEYSSDHPSYHVTKMRHGHYSGDKSKDPQYRRLKYIGYKNADLTTVIYNSNITIKNIPLKAYNYVINGRAAIDWILDQYQIIGKKGGKNKKSYREAGIVDDPNKFKGGKYIFDLLLRIINVSIQSVDLINKLPEMQIDMNKQKLD